MLLFYMYTRWQAPTTELYEMRYFSILMIMHQVLHKMCFLEKKEKIKQNKIKKKKK